MIPINVKAKGLSFLKNKIQLIGNKKKLNVKIKNNPRKEAEKHYYKADHHILKKLGFKITRNINDEIEIMLIHLMKFKENILEKNSP